jgi:tetratricopeptide (TPR) repeat protein
MGELEQAQSQLLEARRLEGARDVDMFRPTVGRWLAQVYLAAGNVARAEAEVQALLALDVDVLADEAEPIQHLRGQILAARGELVEAIQVLYASLARLEEKGMRYQTGRALLVLAGVLAGKDGRAAEAQAHARRAREIFAGLGAKLDLQEAERLIVELAGRENQGEGR